MDVLFPTSVEQAVEMMGRAENSRFMAGGTDLLVRTRAGLDVPDNLIFLEKISSLRGVEVLEDRVRIGAATTLTDILNNEFIRERLPLLHQAADVFASPLVRNAATIGGNICTASPAADTLPPLYALGAEVEFISPDGAGSLPISEFVTGPGQTRLEAGALVRGVVVPLPGRNCVQHYEKVGRRKALAIAVVSLAALLHMENGVITEARLAFGSVGPTVVRCAAAEALLTGHPLTSDVLLEAGRSVQNAISPISDVRASAAYRRQVAANMLLRLA